MSEHEDPDYVSVSGKLTKKAWVRLVGLGSLTIIIGVASINSFGSILATSGNFLGEVVSSTIHRNPIKDPVVVGAKVLNNPFVRYDYYRRSGSLTKCSYEFNYQYLGKEYTGFANDTVDTIKGDYKFYGCVPTGSNFPVYVSKADPSKVWIKPTVTYNDRFKGFVLLLTLSTVPNLVLVKLFRAFRLRRREE